MSRRLAAIVALLALISLAFAAAPTVLAGDPCIHDLSRPATSEGAHAEIGIDECTFLPTVNRVPVGTTVEFVNKSSQAHEVAGANLDWGAHEKLLQPDDRIGWTFDEAGVYAYSCMLHPGMTGAIVVGDTAPTVGEASAVSASAPAQDGGSAAGIALAGAGGLVIGVVAAGILLRRRAESVEPEDPR